MAGVLEQAGAQRDPSSFAPLHTDRIFTGFWPNRAVLRDGASTIYAMRWGLGRQDTILAGYNCEVSPTLTLIRRPGSSVYNTQTFPKVISFYSFHTFTLTSEAIRVLADTASVVYDCTLEANGTSTKTALFTKSAGAVGLPTYFLGVGNNLYITNGVDNKILVYDPVGKTWTTYDWGITAPTTAPTVSQTVRSNPYSGWLANTVVCQTTTIDMGALLIKDPNGNMQSCGLASGNTGITGAQIPSTWQSTTLGGTTPDGTIRWGYVGSANWIASWGYNPGLAAISATVNVPTGTQQMTFVCVQAGVSAGAHPNWPSGVGATVGDGTVIWRNVGVTLAWANVGPNQAVQALFGSKILDPNGYLQNIYQAGKTGPAPGPTFQTTTGSLTIDNGVVWQNVGAFAPAASDILQYGYAYENSKLLDVSNMSPASLPILVVLNNQVTIQGAGSGEAGVDTIPVYRTLQGGGAFYLLGTVANPGAGKTWTYVDTDISPNGVNQAIIAQIVGEGSPLPAGATCLAYHLGRIFAAVGNVVYVSSGPDAVNSGSSGNSGFDQFFTLQSKITRFWVSSIGLIVFTVRDSYIFLGSAQDSDPLYVQVYIPRLPLLQYNCFDEYMNSGYLYLGTRMMMKLDPGSGIVESSFPVANFLLNDVANYDPQSCYLSFHSQGSNETAVYLSNGVSEWLRMGLNTTPETGSAWSPPAILPNGTSAVQSVEVLPGIFSLLIGPQSSGPITKRDRSVATDNGAAFSASSTFGSITLADSSQLAGIAWMTLTTTTAGTAPALTALIGEINGTFEGIGRTRQDPPDLPPASSIRSDRFHFLQSQNPVWCKHFQFAINWPAENAFNELLSFTIIGQVIQELKGS